MQTGAYEYCATLDTFNNPGLEWEDTGANPGGLPWTNGTTSGSHTATYYYSDSNAKRPDGQWGDMANSSQVFLTVTDSWTASVNDDNEIVINLTTTLDSVTRGNLRGNPNQNATNTRTIQVKRTRDGVILWQVAGNPINQNATLATNVSIGTERIVLKPGASASRPSIYIYNHTDGYEGAGSTDEMGGGVSFRNNLPADYRPGASWNGFAWVSHNHKGGACEVWTGTRYLEMRTIDGGISDADPPHICYGGSVWKDMRKIGLM